MKAQGVENAAVNLATETATVLYRAGETDLFELAAAIRKTGYEVATERVTLSIGGMTCASCAAHVQGALEDVPGVVEASVNLDTEKATVSYIPGLVSMDELRLAVDKTGYQVLMDEERGQEESEVDEAVQKMSKARFQMIVAWSFTVPIILWMFAEMFFGILWPNEFVFNLGMIVLALPVLFWVGRKTSRSALTALRHGHANMDSLIALGTGVSLLTGPASFFYPIANYAGVAAMIMAFHLTGRYV
ncbi:MAG: cation transporter, partial [Anaerolineales bacterium]